jgi:hypothetical protein
MKKYPEQFENLKKQMNEIIEKMRKTEQFLKEALGS